MAPKCTPKKRTKNIMSLADKLSIINALQGGEKVAYLARKYNVNESTIRSIRDNQKKIKESAANVGMLEAVNRSIDSLNPRAMMKLFWKNFTYEPSLSIKDIAEIIN